MQLEDVRVVTSYIRPFVVQNEKGEMSGVVYERVKTLLSLLKISQLLKHFLG